MQLYFTVVVLCVLLNILWTNDCMAYATKRPVSTKTLRIKFSWYNRMADHLCGHWEGRMLLVSGLLTDDSPFCKEYNTDEQDCEWSAMGKVLYECGRRDKTFIKEIVREHIDSDHNQKISGHEKGIKKILNFNWDYLKCPDSDVNSIIPRNL